MPWQPLDTGWGFGPVLDLIDSDGALSAPPEKPFALTPESQQRALRDKTSEQSLHLGSFGQLFTELGISNERPYLPISPVELVSEEPISSDEGLFDEDPIANRGATPPTSPKKTSQGLIHQKAHTPDADLTTTPSKELESPPPGLTKIQRKKWRRMIRKQSEVKTLHETQPTPSKHTRKELLKMERIKENLQTMADSAIPVINTPKKHPMKTRAQTRSNVSAKIQPATPAKVDLVQCILKPSTEPFVENQMTTPQTIHPGPGYHTPTPSLPPNSAQLHTPVGPQNQASTLSDTGYFPSQTPVSRPSTRHTALEGLSPSPLSSKTNHTLQVPDFIVHGHGLVPRTVQPVVVPRAQRSIATPQQTPPPVAVQRAQLSIATPRQTQHSVILPQNRRARTPGKLPGPITVRPKVDRNIHFLQQLLNDFPEELPWLVSPMQLCNEKSTTEGIHVFVDASNIMIGFRFAMKIYGGASFEISFDSLALLMERRRPVAKRAFAGSHREADPLPHVTKLQQVSKAVGYENNIIEQVFIRREETDRKRFFKDVERIGFVRASEKSQSRRNGKDSGSDSETGPGAVSSPSAPKWVEQGVDEILHLKMCQSIIDTETPSTMVVATGDGAAAEHSDGFLAQVERALKKGWKVELVSWRQQTNGGYRNKRFQTKWGDRFKIIELDDYLEGLIDTP